jgi:SAM-dependent methyltransferase
LLIADATGSVYPVIDGIPMLSPTARLVETGAPATAERDEIAAALHAKFQAEMDQYSRVCDRWYGPLNEAIQATLRRHYYTRCRGTVVLDVGNGGASAQTVLGPDIAPQVARFVGVDKSWSMLTRPGASGTRLLGDALVLPFADRSVDWVLVNGVIHHLGLMRGQSSEAPVGRFLRECLRVARRGIILFELTVPPYAELVERAIVAARGFMATFVYSAPSLLRTIERVGYPVEELRCARITELVSPFSTMPPILTHEWLRVPVGLIPYSYIFGTILRRDT